MAFVINLNSSTQAYTYKLRLGAIINIDYIFNAWLQVPKF